MLCAAAHPAVSQKYTQRPLQSRLPAVFIAFNIPNSIWSSFCLHPAAQPCTHLPLRHAAYTMLFKNSLLTKANNIQPDQKGLGFQSSSIIFICMRHHISVSVTGVFLWWLLNSEIKLFRCLFTLFLSPWIETGLGCEVWNILWYTHLKIFHPMSWKDSSHFNRWNNTLFPYA